MGIAPPAVRPDFRRHERIFVDGSWIPAGGGSTIEVLDSATELPIGEVDVASSGQLDLAVAAAGRAQRIWARLAPAERAAQLSRLHLELGSRAEQIATLIAAEVGTPIRIARSIQAGLPITVLKSYVDLLNEFEFEERIGNSLVVREPVGVVGAITPWNYPVHQTIAKVAAALAAGCSIVLKPSSLAPLNAFVLAEAVEAAGLLPGVFNLIPGSGSTIGYAMSAHAGIDMISFTGSTEAGVQVARSAAGTLKRLSLELGGKSANVILDDADLAKAVTAGVNNAFLNSGQTCSAWTRMLVPRSALSDVAALVVEATSKLPLGDPFDERTRIGPLVSSGQVEHVRACVESGQQEGAKLITGGPTRPSAFVRGYFFQPTAFANVTSNMRIAQEEVFGPVLAVMAYEDEAEAIEIANSTPYGLAGAVWSADPDRSTRFARQMRTGQVDINGGRFNVLAPFGGVGRSGFGRELGRYGLEEFMVPKSMQY